MILHAISAILLWEVAQSLSCIDSSSAITCDLSNEQKNEYSKYFTAMKPIYGDLYQETGLERRRQCGWKQKDMSASHLPSFVLSVGLEGAGHHLYSELFKTPVFDCVWV